MQQFLHPVGNHVLEERAGVVVFPFVEGGVVADLGGFVLALFPPTRRRRRRSTQ
ncbi:MAG TPA: hypothetical protein VE575_10310 [Acidimicrobiales bacterium]|nr:hypothetical protein [Acidimicrobiales bacterium]